MEERGGRVWKNTKKSLNIQLDFFISRLFFFLFFFLLLHFHSFICISCARLGDAAAYAYQNMFSTSLALPIRWRNVSLSLNASGKMASR